MNINSIEMRYRRPYERAEPYFVLEMAVGDEPVLYTTGPISPEALLSITKVRAAILVAVGDVFAPDMTQAKWLKHLRKHLDNLVTMAT